jgi:hypothetical protein
MTEQTLSSRSDRPKRTFHFQVGEPVEHRGIVVAPLFPLRDPVASYVTLAEAIESGLEIAETGPDGTVPELTVTNPLDEAVLLYDGEELVGAKQNRILDVSVLVAAHSKLTIPVSCVEQGRWRSVSRTFSAARHVSNTELRRAKAAALASLGPARGAAQGEVWRSVRTKLDALGVASATGATRDAFVANKRPIAALESAFAAEAGQCGAVLGIGDELCLDVVSRPEAFAVLWPKLRAGYLLDALGHLDGRPTRPERMVAFVDEVAETAANHRPSAGLGMDLRLHGPKVLGSGLELDGELIQLSAFTADSDRPARPTGVRIARPSQRGG